MPAASNGFDLVRLPGKGHQGHLIRGNDAWLASLATFVVYSATAKAWTQLTDFSSTRKSAWFVNLRIKRESDYAVLAIN